MIVADVYERPSGVPRVLEVLGAEVELQKLAVADYALPADVLVERKTVRDLHLSVVNGTFWRQIGNLRSVSPYPYFLVEGLRLDQGPLERAAIRGACLAVIEQGIRMIRTEDREDTALWLYRLALRREQRKRDLPQYAQRPKPRSETEVAEAFLSAVPGISTASARALLRRFGSVAAVLEAGAEAWEQVPGIGPERAAALATTLNKRISR